jgi:hypothetical protein
MQIPSLQCLLQYMSSGLLRQRSDRVAGGFDDLTDRGQELLVDAAPADQPARLVA